MKQVWIRFVRWIENADRFEEIKGEIKSLRLELWEIKRELEQTSKGRDLLK